MITNNTILNVLLLQCRHLILKPLLCSFTLICCFLCHPPAVTLNYFWPLFFIVFFGGVYLPAGLFADTTIGTAMCCDTQHTFFSSLTCLFLFFHNVPFTQVVCFRMYSSFLSVTNRTWVSLQLLAHQCSLCPFTLSSPSFSFSPTLCPSSVQTLF